MTIKTRSNRSLVRGAWEDYNRARKIRGYQLEKYREGNVLYIRSRVKLREARERYEQEFHASNSNWRSRHSRLTRVYPCLQWKT